MKSILLAFLVVYLGCCALLYFGQRSLLYFPQRGAKVAGVATIGFIHDGIELNGWIVNSGQDKALLYFGGNAEQIQQNITFFRRLLPHHSVYFIAYRGYGQSTGTPGEAELYRDALHIYDQLIKQHRSISLLGRSLGSGVATYVAAWRQVDKLILVTPYDSIENVAKANYWMFPVSWLLRDKYDSLARVPWISAKTLVLVAENDRVIARQHSNNLIAAFAPPQLASRVIKGAEHNTIDHYSEYSESISSFLR